MLMALVIGTVVASRKHERLVGSKIQIVQPLEPDAKTARGDTLVAVDAVGAGLANWCSSCKAAAHARHWTTSRVPWMRPSSASSMKSMSKSNWVLIPIIDRRRKQ